MIDPKFNDSFSKACKTLLYTQPFYGIFLMMLNKKADEKIDTLCVGLRGVNYELLVNPDFWMTNLNTDTQIGALMHECGHMLNFHLTDFDHLTDKRIANFAMDIHINQYIPTQNRQDSWLMPSSFPDLQLAEFQGTNYYYEKLMQAKNAQQQDITAMLEAIGAGAGSCELPSSGETVTFSSHDWEVAEGLNEGSKRIMQAQMGKLIREAAEQISKSRGTIPGNIQEILDRLSAITPPKFDWKGYIRRFIGCSTQVYQHKTRRRYNLRFSKDPGHVTRLHKHVLLALDTSGSVSREELKEFQNEMHHIQRNGTIVTIVQCDTAISHIGPFKPKEDFTIHGRGGTSFQPVIDYYNENLKKFSCLIYMTDGEASDPMNVKGNVLWVLSSTSQKTSSLTGKIIQLEC